MPKIDYSHRATELFLQGFNCAQALYGAFAPALGVEEKTALRTASPFGGGMGRMREVCGAFSGMMLVLSHYFGYADLQCPEKKELYPRVQELGRRFRDRVGALRCDEILSHRAEIGGVASERTPEFYASRPCVFVVETAAKILQEYLEEEKCL